MQAAENKRKKYVKKVGTGFLKAWKTGWIQSALACGAVSMDICCGGYWAHKIIIINNLKTLRDVKDVMSGY